ncbi:cupin domain-containing protein [Blastococcus sp. SYSU D00669]
MENTPGAATVTLPAGALPRRCRARGSDVVLVVLDGCPLVALGSEPERPRPPGSVVVCPRGTPWSWRGGSAPSRLVVVAFPAGPQRAVAALVDSGGLDDATLLAVAADEGLELVLGPVGTA